MEILNMNNLKKIDYKEFGNNPNAPYYHAFLASIAMTLEDKRRLKQDLEQMIEIAQGKK